MYIDPKGIVPELPRVCLFDMSFRPVPDRRNTYIPMTPFSEIGLDM